MLLPLLAFITIHTNFEGGSLGRVEGVSSTHYRVGAKGEKDQDGRNRQANWYYFRVDDAKRGEELKFDVVDLPGEYNYQPNRGAITKDTPPVISFDGLHWKHVETFTYDGREPKLQLSIRPESRRFWIAHVAPYTNDHLAQLRKRGSKSPFFQEERIGRTVGGRDLFLWTIGAPKAPKTIWLMFRQHSWETGSSWAGEGAVLELLANPALREGVLWKILPLCDPDGVARGGVRFNAHGYDLNRNWDVEDAVKMPEISAQRAAIKAWLDKGNRIDLFLSLHNTETGEYLQGPPADFRDLGERLHKLLVDTTSFHPSRPLSFSESTTTPGKTGRMTVIQGLYRDWKVPGFLMEQRVGENSRTGRLPLPADRLKFGAELVRAMFRAVQ